MKTKRQTTVLLIGAAMLLSAPAVNANNITVADNNTGSIVYGTNYTEQTSGWYKGAAGTSGAASTWEYKEVEPGMVATSPWDLAAFVTPSNGRLGIVSAYNLADGYGGTKLGDIMVSTNLAALTGLADPPPINTPYNQFVKNSAFNFGFAVKLNFSLSTFSVFQLDANTVMENGEYSAQRLGGYYNAASQPWRLATGLTATQATASAITGATNFGTLIGGGALSYTTVQRTDVANGTLTGYNVDAAYKYYAEIDTSWLVNPTTVLYKLTMECGNDNMVGIQTGGFNDVSVPDGAATLSLLGISLMAFAGMSKLWTRQVA